MAVPCVHDVDVFPRSRAFLVKANRKKVDLARFMVFVDHVKSQGVIDIVAHVRLEDKVDGAIAIHLFFAGPAAQKQHRDHHKH